ncbi:Hypothetical protein NocV09_00900740 [Nannochloropsis oceanica]
MQRVDPTADLPMIVARGAVRLAKKHYITSSLWVAGLIVLTFFQGFAVPDDSLKQYEHVIKGIDLNKLYALQNDAWAAEEMYRQSKGWFSCDDACQSYKRAWQSAQAKLHNLEKEQEKKQREANKHLGVFSTYGVDEAKQLFWRSFKWGKSFGQRQTMFDMLFMGFRAMRRDEGLLEYTLQILIHFLLNMALGLFMALTGFTLSLWSFIRSYSPDFLTGLLFFAGAFVSAAAMVATYLTLLYGTAGATVFVGVKALLNNANRLEQEGRGPRRNLHYE